MNHRLFVTFYPNYTEINDIILDVKSRKNEGKILILDSLDTNEYVVTYNSSFNQNYFNTVSVHRKMTTKTIYSINGLNELIKSLNNGILNKNYEINWPDYENCVITLRHNELSLIKTKLVGMY